MGKERQEINPKKWYQASELFVRHLNSSEKTIDEIFESIQEAELPYAPPVRPYNLTESTQFLYSNGLIEIREKPTKLVGREVKAQHFRLTIKGAEEALKRGLIEEVELLRVINQYDQETVRSFTD